MKFNPNIGCIEIAQQLSNNVKFVKFNRNIGCIVILVTLNGRETVSKDISSFIFFYKI